MDMNFDQIMDRLFLGGIHGTFNPEALCNQGITYILSVLDQPLLSELVKDFQYKFVYALDLYDADLLQNLEECLDFVEEGRQKGAVLVHCQAGASRSAMVVIAYVMRTCHFNLDEALEFVKNHRPIVKPNQGFLQQLQLFENMGCKVNRAHEEFRLYKLSKLAVCIKSGVYPDTIPPDIYLSETAHASIQDSVFRCKKCRRPLFGSNAQLTHGKGEGESAFDWRSKVPPHRSPAGHYDMEDSKEKAVCQISLFIEPMEWMRGKIEEMEGKLACPKCSIKLGSFVWYGERCPCGAWVSPAFHIQRSKVDEMKPRAVQPSLVTANSVPKTPLVMDTGISLDCKGIDVRDIPLF